VEIIYVIQNKEEKMKDYLINVLYDNGMTEEFKVKGVGEEDIEELTEIVIGAFYKGANGYLELGINNGEYIVLNLSKVTRVNIKDVSFMSLLT
jgi:hypothetical protein